MRPEFDKQFDSLLREHARRAVSTSRDARSSEREVTAAAAHLDADELSAFAENALPASVRARHTSHLADCGDCRRLVSQIALASGVADEIERREPSHAAGLTAAAVPSASRPAWRERLAGLFRPGAWRYALPLAALLVVSAAVLLVTSGRRRAGLGNLAVSTEKARPGRAAELHHPANQKQQAQAPAAVNQNTATSDAPAGVETGQTEARAADPQTPAGSDKPASAAAGSIGGVSQGAQQELAKRESAEATAPAATFAAEPVSVPTPSPVPPPPAQQPRDPAAAPQPTPVADELRDHKAAEGKEKDRFDERNAAQARKQRGHGPMRNESQQQMNARNRQAEESQADGASRSGAKSEDDSPRKSERNSAGGARVAPPAAARGEIRREKSGEGRGDAESRGVETRSVGGRRFRREDAAWVDTSYRPAQATVIVSRGSEQYRSLVGDEPDLARIANALGGEVVVVWKGRAYRIKP